MSKSTEPDVIETPRGAARGRGRRLAQVVYYTFMAAIALGSLYQIAHQVFAPQEAPEPAVTECKQGLRLLYGAIDGGRREADQVARTADPGSEASLTTFRERLSRTWRQRDRVAELCAGDELAMETLAAVERLRYAEENGVRFRASKLIPLRYAAERAIERIDAQQKTGSKGGPNRVR